MRGARDSSTGAKSPIATRDTRDDARRWASLASAVRLEASSAESPATAARPLATGATFSHVAIALFRSPLSTLVRPIMP